MDYNTLIVTPVREMTGIVLDFIPTLLIALGILMIGWIVARFTRKILNKVFTVIKLDKVAGDMGINAILRNGGIKHKLGEMLSCLVYTVMVIMTFILTIKSLGLTVGTGLVHSIFGYIPHVVVGTLTLIVGMLVAKVVSSLVYVTAKNTDMPIPETLRDLSKMAIVVYVSIMFLREIGFMTLFAGNYTIFIGGIVFALALAFGLAGKDVASKYLGVLK